MVEAVGVGEDLGVDLLARDPVIDTVEDRRSRLDGVKFSVVSKTFPDTGAMLSLTLSSMRSQFRSRVRTATN